MNTGWLKTRRAQRRDIQKDLRSDHESPPSTIAHKIVSTALSDGHWWQVNEYATELITAAAELALAAEQAENGAEVNAADVVRLIGRSKAHLALLRQLADLPDPTG
ncbi:hypothetical protein [Catellatospora sichuanensis]|uniref:hypothetical protein n=1 Tax=Catellatospora sichuanensis TaxID=1969805 RepID=UPI001183F416|nr:hypothetical protein [Catellatospora sichuanensis]